MKKTLMFIMLILLVFTISITNVSALDTKIKKIDVTKKSDTSIVVDSSIKDGKFTPSIVFKKVGDYVTYKLTLDFDTWKYKIAGVTDNNKNRYIITNYTYDYNIVYLTIKYDKALDGDFELKDISFDVELMANDDGIIKKIVNPETMDSIVKYYIIIVITTIIISALLLMRKNRYTSNFLWIILLVPLSCVIAENIFKIDLTIDTENIKVEYGISFDGNSGSGIVKGITCFYGEKCKLNKNSFTKEGKKFKGWSLTSDGEVLYSDEDIVKNLAPEGIINLVAVWGDFGPATFDVGRVVNTKLKMIMQSIEDNIDLKEYDGQDYSTEYSFNFVEFNRVYEKPNIEELINTNIISSEDSEESIYIWADKTNNYGIKLLWYTDSDVIYLNPDSSHMFSSFGIGLTLGGFDSVRASNVLDMSYMFRGDEFETSIVKDWDVSKVTNMSHMFENAVYVDFSKLSNWDVSSVADMSYMFRNVFEYDSGTSPSFYHYNDASFIENWDVRNVTNFEHMFMASTYYWDDFGVSLDNFTYPIFTLKPGSWDNSLLIINNEYHYSGTYLEGLYIYTALDGVWTRIGESIDDIPEYFDDVDEAIELANERYTLYSAIKYKITDGVVEKAWVVFRRTANGKTYTLDPNPDAYEDNKQQMIEAFGSNKCGDDDGRFFGEEAHYVCHEYYPSIYAGDGYAAGENAFSYPSGLVGYSDGPFYRVTVSYSGYLYSGPF